MGEDLDVNRVIMAWEGSGSGVEVELDDNWVSGGAPVFKLEAL